MFESVNKTSRIRKVRNKLNAHLQVKHKLVDQVAATNIKEGKVDVISHGGELTSSIVVVKLLQSNKDSNERVLEILFSFMKAEGIVKCYTTNRVAL